MDKLNRVVECLKQYEPEKIILFGSCAIGEVDEFSDIDLVVIKNTEKRFLKRLIEASGLIDLEIDKVDVFVYTPEEWERMIKLENLFALEVSKNGRLLYEKR